MNTFAKALIAETKHEIIPDELDYFAPLIGEWSFNWHDNIGAENESNFEGKWTFSRVLEGRGIQDTFVTSKINPVITSYSIHYTKLYEFFHLNEFFRMS